MSFLWNWWSGKKPEEEKKDEEKEEEEEIEEKEENEENEEKEDDEDDDKEKDEKDEKDENVESNLNEEEKEDNKSKNKKEKGKSPVINKKTHLKKINRPDLSTNKDDPLHWNSVVYGPENSPYDKGIFEILINFEKNKPDKPMIQFKTKIYHYNIKQNNGELVCPYIWNKKLSEKENLEKIKLLMTTPDSRYPCSYFIQEEYYNDFPAYKQKAMKFTEDYAMN